ncbi:MAG: TolC family protein [Acidobacteriia bacterium]|nr:TolC family protein [Terriglobia bacterium]
MTQKFIALVAVLTLSSALSDLNAQSGAQTATPLTLQQAEQIAMKNHPRVFAAQYNALAATQVVREARSSYFPTLQADVTGSVADHNTRLGAGYLSSSQLFNRFGQGISLDQLITDFGRTSNLVASSRFQAQAASDDAQATRYDVLLAVNQSYFEVLRSQALLKVAQTTVSERQVVLDQVSAMVQNKLKSELDLSFAQVNLAQANLFQIRAQNNIKIAQAELARAMGQQNPEAYTLAEQPLPSPPPETADPLVAQAMQNRPEILSAQASRDSAYKFQRAERDLSLPTVVAEGDAGVIPLVAQLTLPRLIPDHYEAAAVNIQVPIFNGHLFAARRQAALMRARAADEGLRDTQGRVARDVRTAWANAVTNYQQIDVATKLLNQAKLALALAQGRYNLGLSSIVELSQAQLNETEAEIQEVNARYDFENQNAVLQYQVGLLR